MNKIFKVIWSKTTHSLVVVSELATNQGKAATVVSEGKNPSALASGVFSLTLIASLLMSAMPTAQAAVSVPGSGSATASTTPTVAYNYSTPDNMNYLGQSDTSRYSGSLAGAQAVAVGGSTNASNGSVAVGDYANASANLSLALGAFSQTVRTGAIALGTATLASGFN